MIRKNGVLFFAFLIFVILTSLASAINLELNKTAINDIIIKDLNNVAIFDLTIKNLEQDDNFEIYSLVGVELSPKEAFSIAKDETKTIQIEIKALESVKKNSGYFTFVYKIRNYNGEIQEDKLTIKLINLKEAFELTADNIAPDSEKIKIYVKNRENFKFGNIEAEFSSVFFNFKKNFSLNALGKESFITEIDKEKLKALVAGNYLLDAKIKVNEVEEIIGSTIKFLEKSGLLVEETKDGFLVARHEIEKKNEGNLVTLAEIKLEKNIFSRLFTTFNLVPNKIERIDGKVLYTWQKEIRPGESLKVVAKTNWLILLLIIIAVITIIFLIQTYLTSDIILRKKINFVKTKGGEFALKISINVKARRFVERINVVDKLPPIVKIYERYGTLTPDRIDEKNRRVEWNIGSLNKNEESILSYIVYSKIGIVGKFELPSAKAVYERNGKIKETESNRVFFLSEPKKIEKIERY